ncbi:MAG TPA: bifunctional methylenetetrahydrofolate dehydrogenase/methenyltetrahydrofolate cyclohydrolase FolD [Salinivirga sp.]|uniref:bifunctional methylenetetrahydrofolate dehydrogenase/methenyltetrahydrofolate cyclohydrolase FolD n=1 Tax=Salinivirga sp. TaxID=1970192 RepID=UPI002B48E533|nr:bifunctional methylenetetrahydrofolate dehydrogenase/methenyltetrahydrofolate cyclohydrolase FolD [Salinivirga sp.]HKK59549.1 bifunctional methylenetetrahydrofolate dehydrogenase/methenyltetrahydrofolate cyclohydrolase FolD [Salinivirga sp.]
MQLIDGKKISQQLKDEIAEATSQRKQKGLKAPHLAVILVGEDGGSQTYVRMKVKACEQVGFKSTKIDYPDTVTEDELLAKIKEINADNDIDGLLVQLPLPIHISEEKVIESIDPSKDVDGFHPISMGKLVAGMPTFLPATPAGIMELLERYEIDTEGKHCVVLGRSHIVGTPMTLLMSRKAKPGNATVTMCHSRTKNLEEITRQADIIIAALGAPEFLKADMVKEGVVVIDVGTTRVKSDKTKSGWKLKGDVAFDEVAEKASYITPVPGGVGPMTIASLLKNTLKAVEMKEV